MKTLLTKERPTTGEVRAGLSTALFVLYSWALAYLTDLPFMILGISHFLLALAALAALFAGAYYLSARPVRRLWNRASAAAVLAALALAVLALIGSAALHDALRQILLGMPPGTTTTGVPAALRWACLVSGGVFAAVWLVRILRGRFGRGEAAAGAEEQTNALAGPRPRPSSEAS